MTRIRHDTLINRVRLHLMEDPRIATEAEADAELNLMGNAELVEVLSFVLGQMEEEGAEPAPIFAAQ